MRTLSRRSLECNAFSVPVTAVLGDVADREAVRRAASGAEVIVHLAALLHIVDPAPALREQYERVNVGGTSAVMAAAVAEGASRVVLMSTIAVYGSAAAQRGVDEDAPARPESFYAQTKLAAEQVALAARRADGLPLATVLRSAAVYGPRVKGNYERLVRALAKRRFLPIGPGDNLRTVVHEEDLASAVALAARAERAAGRVYNVSDGEPHPLRDIIAAICAALGRNPPRGHLPVLPIRAAARLAGLVDHRLTHTIDKYFEQVAIDASRIRSELGFHARVGLMDGWAATIAEMRRSGQL
jgi:nucleoside-diphosphate-sugar epimerase